MENPVYGEGYTQASWWERWLTKMIEDIPLWAAWAGTLLAAVLAITALVTGVIVTRRAVRTITRYVRALTHGRSAEDILTVVAATIATGVSAQGMWNFFGDVLHVIWPLRLVFFAFIEVAVVTSAVRARRSMREKYSAGIDGIAVWALATLTAVLSALDAASHAEAVFRLAAPLVAAWLWERGMALERRRITGLKGINWRITPERILVRLGLAEANGRTAAEVDAQRYITGVALAVMHARDLRDTGAPRRKLDRAVRKLRKALSKAVEYANLAKDPQLQKAMLDQIGALCSVTNLMDIPAVAPWSHIDHPAVTGKTPHSDVDRLVEALREWSDTVRSGPAPDARAMVRALAAAVTGRPVTEMTTNGATTGVTASPVIGVTTQVASDVTTNEATTPRRPLLRRIFPRSAAPAGVPTPPPAADTPAVATRPAGTDQVVNDQKTALDHPADSDQTGTRRSDRGGRTRPDEQDNAAARAWIREQAIGENGIGRLPSQREVARHFGFSKGWGRLRLQEAAEQLAAEGYEVRGDHTVIAPHLVATRRSDQLVAVNGHTAE